MAFLTDLWLPILLCAVLVFIASSILHMLVPLHKSDYKKMPDEDKVLETMRSCGLRPGAYMFPAADSIKDMSTPEMKAKLERGPIGVLTVMTGGFNMGKRLTQWFAFLLVISVFVAYTAWHGLEPGATYLAVFQVTGAAAMLGYAVPAIGDSIWKGQSWTTTAKFIFDGAVYGLVTAGTFGWLWPELA